MAVGCSCGYDTNSEKVFTFSFPLGKFDLIEKWIKFINRNNWFSTKNSVLCIKHKYILKGKRNKLNWNLQPIPTIYSEKIIKPSLLPTQKDFRKTPKQRRIEKDELQDFLSTDTIADFTQLTVKCCPSDFEFKKHVDYILIYRIVFDIETHFASIKECVRIDRNLLVQLQCNGSPIPITTMVYTWK